MNVDAFYFHRYSLMCRCWTWDPDDRPKWIQLNPELQTLYAQLAQYVWHGGLGITQSEVALVCSCDELNLNNVFSHKTIE